MKIAVFGGSFDPVHNEHIQLVKAAIVSLRLDKLFVMPAHTPPHKSGKTLTSNSDRLEMCRLAFSGIDKVEISDYEIEKGGTSYTYLTCRHFRELYPQEELFWLVGTDMLRDFPTWKNPESILQDVTLAVCARNEKTEWVEKEQALFFERFQTNFALIQYNGADVSSTKLRVLAAAGEPLMPFTPLAVETYIQEKNLYKIPFADQALALEKQSRKEHSVRVAMMAAKKAMELKIPEEKAITAALFHDCAKNLPVESSYLQDFILDTAFGEVPKEVAHQFAGAYVAEKFFAVKDEDVLNAIRYHTSGRPRMSDLEKLIFLSDMLEEGRAYDVVDDLRYLFHHKSLNECLKEALFQTLQFLKKKNEKIYPLTEQAYEYVCQEQGTEV